MSITFRWSLPFLASSFIKLHTQERNSIQKGVKIKNDHDKLGSFSNGVQHRNLRKILSNDGAGGIAKVEGEDFE
jgi:hypothetical protein